jgi:hypothetical protein
MDAAIGSIVPPSWKTSFTTARAALCSDDVTTARPLLDKLASAVPEDLEVRLYAAWARARLADSVTDAERDALEALARRTLGGGHSLALPLCILGHGAARRGELHTARALFRRACAADPELVDARRGLQRVERWLAGGGGNMAGGLARGEVDAPRVLIAIVFVIASLAAVLSQHVS